MAKQSRSREELDRIYRQLYPQGLGLAARASREAGEAEAHADLVTLAQGRNNRMAQIGLMAQPFYDFGSGAADGNRAFGTAAAFGDEVTGGPAGMYDGRTNYARPYIDISAERGSLQRYRQDPDFFDDIKMHESGHAGGQLLGPREYRQIARAMYPNDRPAVSEDHVILFSNDFANSDDPLARSEAKSFLERIIGRRLSDQEIESAASIGNDLLGQNMQLLENRSRELRQARAARRYSQLNTRRGTPTG